MAKNPPPPPGVRDRGRTVGDWDLGNERLLRNGYRLVPVPEAEALAKLGGNEGPPTRRAHRGDDRPGKSAAHGWAVTSSPGAR